MNRIKQLRADKGIKQAELAKAISVSPAALSGYETGKYEADIETYQKIAEFFNVTMDYLLGNDTAKASDAVRIPVLGSVPAGIPIEAIEDILDWEEIPAAMTSGDREYFALEVKGDSMWPEILPGDVVIVERKPCCNNGDICVVYVNGSDATLKTVKLDEEARTMTIVPKNPNYAPRTFNEKEIRELPVSIAGVVVELRRKIKK